MPDESFLRRVGCKLACALLVPLCLGWASWQAWARPASEFAAPPASEFPATWQGRPLRPLALSEVEERFARRFPGTLARLTDGRDVLVWREVLQPTRMLHPAADCFQGLGWEIGAQRLQLDEAQQMWRCFEASHDGQRLRVCERIVDAAGGGFTDASAWYWAALLGQSRGPWQAFTVASPL